MKKTISLIIIFSIIFTLNVVAEEKTGLIRGNVYSNGRLLENVKVEIKELNKSKIISNGKFEFSNLEHTYDKKPYTFIFEKDGYITETVKRNIGINRLTLLNVELEKINNKVKGKTLRNTKVKIGDREVITDDREFTFENLIPDKYKVEFIKVGYDPKTKEIEVKNNDEKELPFQSLIMKEVEYNDFEENNLIGYYFFSNQFDIENMFYPYLYLRKNNLEEQTVAGNVKLVMSSFILAQDFEIVQFVNQNGFVNEKNLIDKIEKLYSQNPEKIKKELKLLNKFREDLNSVYDIEEDIIYSAYHINVTDINIDGNKTVESKLANIFRNKFLNNEQANLSLLNNELEESTNITESMRNITNLKAEDLLEFEDTYLITANNKTENINYELKRQTINREQIESIYQFFNLFDEDFIRNFANPYIIKAHFKINDKWKVIFDEN